MIIHIGKTFWAVTSSLVLVGCSGNPDIVLRNTTTQAVDDVYVSWPNFKSMGGRVYPGGELVHGRVSETIGKTANVQWRTGDGVLHQTNIPLRESLPRAFDGQLVFQINSHQRYILSATSLRVEEHERGHSHHLLCLKRSMNSKTGMA
jgi:hypothetical protein